MTLSDNKVYLVGAGGHLRSLYNIFSKKFVAVGIFDDSYKKGIDENIMGIPLTGTLADITNQLLLINTTGSLPLRNKVFKRFDNQWVEDTLMHETVILEKDVLLGKCNQLLANVYINSGTTIGNFNLVNTGVIIEHECRIGNANHISVGSRLCGRAEIGNGCFIGAGAIITDKKKIADNVVVGAGSVVIKDITEAGTYVGVPAKRIK